MMKKVLEFKKDKPKRTIKKLNKKKLAIIITIIVIAIILLVTAIVYTYNEPFRDFMDKYVLRKNITDENVPIIEIDYDSNTNVIPYGKYICILAENNLQLYNSSGKKEQELKVEINNPIYNANGKYLVIGEENSQKLYLISGSNIVWEKDVDGNLLKVNVNKNGYVSTIVSGTTYKSVITTYDSKGNELFKSYLSSTIAVDSCISPDNKYLAYAEVNTSGTVIKSNIKIISVEEAREKNTEPEFTYNADQNSLVLRIKYQDKNRLICMYDNSIHMIESNVDVKLMDLSEESKVTFGDCELTNFVYRTVEQSTGPFSADTIVQMLNISNQKENTYTVDGVAKSVTSYDNIIAVNLGSEVEFINTSGFLVKKYTSSQEIRNIVICDGLAGTFSRDKIELVNL